MKKLRMIMNCIGAAFAVYSRIPVPQVEWNPETLRWQICGFPLVGAAVGLLWTAAGILLTLAGAEPVLTGAVLCTLPLLLTGGIHMDGFLDTCDAVHSWRSREERLRILKDPHVGAFAVIYGGIYLILSFGLCVQAAATARELMAGGFAGQAAGNALAQVTGREPPGFASPFLMMVPCFVISRVFSGLSVIYFPKAKKDGMLHETAEASDGNAGKVLLAELAAALGLFFACAFVLGLPGMVFLPAAGAGVFLLYRHMALTYFGGTSGDLAGWFLEVCELVLLGVTVLCLAVG